MARYDRATHFQAAFQKFRRCANPDKSSGSNLKSLSSRNCSKICPYCKKTAVWSLCGSSCSHANHRRQCKEEKKKMKEMKQRNDGQGRAKALLCAPLFKYHSFLFSLGTNQNYSEQSRTFPKLSTLFIPFILTIYQRHIDRSGVHLHFHKLESFRKGEFPTCFFFLHFG